MYEALSYYSDAFAGVAHGGSIESTLQPLLTQTPTERQVAEDVVRALIEYLSRALIKYLNRALVQP